MATTSIARFLTDEDDCTPITYLPVGRSDAVAAGWGSLAIDRHDFLQTGFPSPALMGRLSRRESEGVTYNDYAGTNIFISPGLE